MDVEVSPRRQITNVTGMDTEAKLSKEVSEAAAEKLLKIQQEWSWKIKPEDIALFEFHFPRRFEIHVRKIRLPQHKGFAQKRLDHMGEWEVEVIEVGLEGVPGFEFLHQEYRPTQQEALWLGHYLVKVEMLNDRAVGS